MTKHLLLAAAAALTLVSCSNGDVELDASGDATLEPTDTATDGGTTLSLDEITCDSLELEMDLTGDAEGSFAADAQIEGDRVFGQTPEQDAEIDATLEGDELIAARFVSELGGTTELSLYTFKTVTIFSGEAEVVADGGDAVTINGTLSSGDESLEVEISGEAGC